MQDTKTEKTEKIPLRMDAHGALRVGGTQVTLDVLMDAYDQGATPEQITQKFGELRLDDVYAVITYYTNAHKYRDIMRKMVKGTHGSSMVAFASL
jgi:uncharacterized protein (DUF433 family)